MEPISLLEEAARLLESLTVPYLFLGGGCVPLLIEHAVSRPARFTKDIDIAVEIVSRADYANLELELNQLGFLHDFYGPLCRFRRGGLILDAIPMESSILGFPNVYLKYAFYDQWHRKLPSGRDVKVISPPAFLAAKLEAFNSPGRENSGDMLASRDFEDIVTVLEGCLRIVDLVDKSVQPVREYVSIQFASWMDSAFLEDGVAAQLEPLGLPQATVQSVIKRIESISNLRR